MIFSDSHESVSYPGIIREASSSSRWEQMQRPIARYFVKRESKWEISNKSPSLGTQEIRQKKKGTDCESQREERKRPCESAKQGAYEITETGATSTEPKWVCIRYSAYILLLLAYYFYIIAISLQLWDS